MKVGDVLEAAIWITGDEPPGLVDHHKRAVEETIAEENVKRRVLCGPVVWTAKRPEDPRVPAVPKHISGSDVRLLVCEAEILDIAPPPGRFLAELEPKDLALLRSITRIAYERQYPGHERLTDKQCDRLINDLGPEAAVAALSRGSATIQ